VIVEANPAYEIPDSQNMVVQANPAYEAPDSQSVIVEANPAYETPAIHQRVLILIQSLGMRLLMSKRKKSKQLLQISGNIRKFLISVFSKKPSKRLSFVSCIND
jgi:hypothetical protein